jgi:membrane-bound lytic murein transglycosylase A
MLKFALFISVMLLISGCSKQQSISFDFMPKTELIRNNIDAYDRVDAKDFSEILQHFQNNCKLVSVQKLYKDLCLKSLHVNNAKTFFLKHFDRYQIVSDEGDGLLTGYFEPLLYGSRTQSHRYRYPLYRPPSDLLHVRLGDAYPELANMRLRGRFVDGEIVAYPSREQINTQDNNLSAICYVDDRIDRFFLEVQGSGRVLLDSGETIFVGYADQNGHVYASIGKTLIDNNAIAKEEISLQSIRKWLMEHPESLDEILHVNRSFVFFQERSHAAKGSLGVVLTPLYSVAVDPLYIPLGSLLSIETASYHKMVFAEDTGGAIKGSVRADLFLGFGDEALQKAGHLQENLKLFMWLPKKHHGTIQE